MKHHILIVGGGMITHDQLLPTVYHMQRCGKVGEISICGRTAQRLQDLRAAPDLVEAFPGQSFRSFPDSNSAPPQPRLFRKIIRDIPPRSIVMVAVPDDLHFEVVMAALHSNHHVCVVKPLVLKYMQTLEIADEAYRRGLVVGIDYHKRFDHRSLTARLDYRAGRLGEFRMGSAFLLEKWFYRHSNFQTWLTTERSDAFTYIGCHYVDLVHFITGLLPRSVSVYGIPDAFPNRRRGFLWADARVTWENGACLNVQCALGLSDSAPGTNAQGLTMFCSGKDDGALIFHSDQFRGIKRVYLNRDDRPGRARYTEPSGDYFEYVNIGGQGLTPVGYGYRSLEYILEQCISIDMTRSGRSQRQKILREIDAGIMATPRNSSYNELVIEAARESIAKNGKTIVLPRLRSRGTPNKPRDVSAN